MRPKLYLLRAKHQTRAASQFCVVAAPPKPCQNRAKPCQPSLSRKKAVSASKVRSSFSTAARGADGHTRTEVIEINTLREIREIRIRPRLRHCKCWPCDALRRPRSASEQHSGRNGKLHGKRALTDSPSKAEDFSSLILRPSKYRSNVPKYGRWTPGGADVRYAARPHKCRMGSRLTTTQGWL